MLTISKGQFDGTTQELAARVHAFDLAKEGHKSTVGVPAPREIDLIEYLSATGAKFNVEEPAPVPAPTKKEVREKEIVSIEVARNTALSESVSWNGRRWHIDQTFTSQLTWLITTHLAGLAPAGMTHPIRTFDNETVQLGIDDLKSLASVVLGTVQQIWLDSFTQKDALPPL